MGWVRLDDNFADHPKIIALSDTAFRLFITGLCYSNRQLTDGLIPYQIVNSWVGEDPMKPSDELEDQGLWERYEKGFRIRSYEEYQPTKEQVEQKRAEARERLKRHREMKRVSNAKETPTPTHPNPSQPNINIPTTEWGNLLEDEIFDELDENSDKQVEVYAPNNPAPRVKSAKLAVERIVEKLTNARNAGVNSWNLSKLVEEQWDGLHDSNDIGGCIALTAWYVSELQSRKLSSSEISRIGQMIKRFGRIALLAIDEASSKDLNDLVSYAFRVAQRMYDEKKVK